MSRQSLGDCWPVATQELLLDVRLSYELYVSFVSEGEKILMPDWRLIFSTFWGLSVKVEKIGGVA